MTKIAENSIYTFLAMMNRARLLSTGNVHVINFISYIVSNHKKGRIIDTEVLLKILEFKCKEHSLDPFHLDSNIFQEVKEIFARIYEMKTLIEELEYIR